NLFASVLVRRGIKPSNGRSGEKKSTSRKKSRFGLRLKPGVRHTGRRHPPPGPAKQRTCNSLGTNSELMNNLLIVFIAVTAATVLLQAGILAGMYFAMRKTSARVELLAEEVKTKVLPAAELAHTIISDLRPKVETLMDNVSVSTSTIRAQVERVDATLTDI